MTRRLLPSLVALSLVFTACARPGVEEQSTAVPSPGRTSATANQTDASPTASPSHNGTAGEVVTTPGTATPPQRQSCAAMAAALPVEQQVGQLIMVGVTSTDTSGSVDTALSAHHVGAVVLLGDGWTSAAKVQVLTQQLGSVNPDLPVLVAVDQEGGQVQRLKGDDFSEIPSAVQQASTDPEQLSQQWTRWAGELLQAGVRMNLAPVADVVPEAKVGSNAPIGQLKRNYGTTPQATSPLVKAAVKGMNRGGVTSSVKHFPGLGEVTTNTDFGQAQDEVTTAGSPNLQPFVAGMEQGVGSVMVSSAVYPRIDPDHRAVFSSKIITDLLRGKLGWQGVVISDDLGAAASVSEVPAEHRAVQFVAAGGDLVINAEPGSVPAMANGLVQRAKSDPAFAEQVRASAGRVIALKALVGLVECT